MEEEKKEEKVEVLEEKSNKKDNKNSAVLIFAILGGLVFMIMVVACVMVLPSLMGSSKSNNKIGNDAQDVYSTYRMTGNSLDNFDLAFLKLENNGKNEVYSPLSIKYALAMLSEGSNGSSKNQINAIIGDYKSKKYPNNDHMSFANAVFIRNTYEKNVKDEYKKNVKDKYNAEVIVDEFKDASNMNKWVKEKTFNLITDFFDDSTVQREDFELTNALAIDMKWNNQIQCATGSEVPCINYSISYNHEKEKGTDNRFGDYVSTIYNDKDYYALSFDGKENIKAAEVKAAFNRYDAVKEIGEDKIIEEVGNKYREWLASEDGQNNLKYGYAEEDVDTFLAKYIKELNENYNREDYSTDFMIYTDDNVKAFAKDLKTYDDVTLQYVGIMPTKTSLKDYIDNVNTDDINGVINGLKEMKKENFKDGVVTLVHGYIPMFDYEYKMNLMDDLKELGIKDVFDAEKADLSNMIKKTNGEFISSASHKAKIEFSNDGIKAAAVTALGGKGATGAGFDYFYEIPIERIDITFDKPFIYIIRDKATGEVWFAGSVYEPKTK